MRGVKLVARLTLLVMVALWFTTSAPTVWASSPEQVSQGVEVEHATQAVAAEKHGEATHEGEAVEEEGVTTSQLWNLFWRVLNFAVLLFILVKYVIKPIGVGLGDRRQRIKDEIEGLEARKVKAEQSYKDFETKLAGVEREIDKVVERAVAQAEMEKAKIIEKAEQAAADIQRQAEMTIQNEIMEARRTLKNDIADQAAAMAEELIVKNLTADDQVKIVEDYLAKVGAVQ